MTPIHFGDWEEKLYLKDNPFRVTPPRQHEEIIWADLSELKAKLEESIHAAIQTSPSNLILNWGAYGGGKTHSAWYYTQRHILVEMEKQFALKSPLLALNLNMPRTDSHVLRALYIDLLSRIKFRNLQKKLLEFFNKFNQPQDARDLLESFTGSEDFAKAISDLATLHPNSGKPIFGSPVTISPEEKLNLLKKYFFQQTVKKELDELQLVREIETAGDIITMLTTLLNLFVFRMRRLKPPVYWKIFLWIDEVEDLSALPGKEQTMFTNFLRDILDAVPNHLTIFINFTLRPTEEYEDLGILLRDAVMSRIRKEIHFEELDQPHHVHRYIQELLTHPQYRPDDLKEQCPDWSYFPFDSESLAYLSSVLSGRTPHLINDACTLLVERALIEGVFEKPENRIDRAFIEKHESIIPSAQKVPRSDR